MVRVISDIEKQDSFLRPKLLQMLTTLSLLPCFPILLQEDIFQVKEKGFMGCHLDYSSFIITVIFHGWANEQLTEWSSTHTDMHMGEVIDE